MLAVQHRSGMGFATLGALFGPFLGVGLSLVAVKYTQAGIATSLMSLLPVLIIPPSLLIRKERVTLRGILGATVAVAGAALLF
jgi:drug/metabolite transporter (DMT)-like permease